MLQSNRVKLVVLDQNLKALHDICRLTAPWFDTIPTPDPREAMARLQQDQSVKVFLTEQILSNTTGIALLGSIRSMRPDVRRVLMCDDGELAPVIEGLHSGAIGRLLYKPFQPNQLLAAVGVATATAARATA